MKMTAMFSMILAAMFAATAYGQFNPPQGTQPAPSCNGQKLVAAEKIYGIFAVCDDPKSGSPVVIWLGPSNSPNSLAFSSDGTELLQYNASGALTVSNVYPGQLNTYGSWLVPANGRITGGYGSVAQMEFADGKAVNLDLYVNSDYYAGHPVQAVVLAGCAAKALTLQGWWCLTNNGDLNFYAGTSDSIFPNALPVDRNVSGLALLDSNRVVYTTRPQQSCPPPGVGQAQACIYNSPGRLIAAAYNFGSSKVGIQDFGPTPYTNAPVNYHLLAATGGRYVYFVNNDSSLGDTLNVIDTTNGVQRTLLSYRDIAQLVNLPAVRPSGTPTFTSIALPPSESAQVANAGQPTTTQQQ